MKTTKKRKAENLQKRPSMSTNPGDETAEEDSTEELESLDLS